MPRYSERDLIDDRDVSAGDAAVAPEPVDPPEPEADSAPADTEAGAASAPEASLGLEPEDALAVVLGLASLPLTGDAYQRFEGAAEALAAPQSRIVRIMRLINVDRTLGDLGVNPVDPIGSLPAWVRGVGLLAAALSAVATAYAAARRPDPIEASEAEGERPDRAGRDARPPVTL